MPHRRPPFRSDPTAPMTHIHTTSLVVRGYECGPDRIVGLPRILSYMEHARWEWILRPELGLVDGLHSGHFFVVHRQTVARARTFGIGTRAIVRAALRQVGRVQCTVEQDLVRDDGVLLARAHIVAVWLGPGGHMARIPERTREAVTDEPMVSHRGEALAGVATSFLAPDEHEEELLLEPLVQRDVPEHAERRPMVVRPSDCDMFGHVNGSSYVRFAEDALFPAQRLDVEYRGQAVPHDEVVVRTWAPEVPTAQGQQAFALQRGDQTLCRAVLTPARG
jgi:acyl-CoA thioesterase FadM